MTTRTRVDLTFAALTGACLGLSVWDPSNALWQEAPFFTVMAGVAWSTALARKDQAHTARRAVWLWPALALALALQVVWSSDPAQRVESALLGAGLLVAASALAWRQQRPA